MIEIGSYVCLVHRGKNHFSTSTLSKGDVKHPICPPLGHWSHINMNNIACPHNIQWNSTWTTPKDGSIWPSTLGSWHNAQLHTWSFHVWPSWPSNNNTPKGKPVTKKRGRRDKYKRDVTTQKQPAMESTQTPWWTQAPWSSQLQLPSSCTNQSTEHRNTQMTNPSTDTIILNTETTKQTTGLSPLVL
jgi:hypothetical protein